MNNENKYLNYIFDKKQVPAYLFVHLNCAIMWQLDLINLNVLSYNFTLVR